MISDYKWNLYLHGCDDPAILESEMQGYWEDDMIQEQDDMEARGGPIYRPRYPDDEIPF